MDFQNLPSSPPESSQVPILTQHDTQILNQILSPGLAPPLTNVVDLSLPSPPPSLLTLEASILAPLNTAYPSSSTVRTAIDALSDLIAMHPYYASAYNNRAQATRLLLGDDLRANEGVWADLSEAITLISGAEESSPKKARVVQVSKHEASVLSKAHTQRAWLLWKLAKSFPPEILPTSSPKVGPVKEAADDAIAAEPSSTQHQLPAQLRGLNREDLEEMANRGFAMGGKYGDSGALGMSLRTNLYTKLCSEVVKEAMRGDILGDSLREGNSTSFRESRRG